MVPVSAQASFFGSRGLTWFELAFAFAICCAFLIPGIWSYTLVDPWETHYSEVARRMLQDDDWIHLNWQNEGFRSKPVLTFWLIAASLKVFGIGGGGGYSGEMVQSDLLMFAARLPFVLFGIMGLVCTFWVLAKTVSRRVAWLSMLVCGTTPMFFLVARQAITDMPLVGCLMGSMACFILAMESDDGPLRPLWKKLTSLHVFAAAMVFLVGWQIIYYGYYFSKYPDLAQGIRIPRPGIVFPLVMSLGLGAFLAWVFFLKPTVKRSQVLMYWFYALLGVSALGKGLPALGLAGVICFFYLALTGEWWRLRVVEIPRGIVIIALIAVPWHVAMWAKDGRPFLQQYFVNHLWRRATTGVHGERGTFNFFMSEIGYGMWQWAALLPAAVAAVVGKTSTTNRADRVRLIFAMWAIVTVAFFSAIQTKFHHYILPAVPALGVLVAFWLDDLIAGRVRTIGIAALSAVAILGLLVRDLMWEEKNFIEMFVYRYDRPWPSGDPWLVDLADPILFFGLALMAMILGLMIRPLRKVFIWGLAGVSIAFALWTMNVYMKHAGTHWGMREAVREYYSSRQIHGVDIQFYGLHQIADRFGSLGPDDLVPIETFVPRETNIDQPMHVRVSLMTRDGRTRERDVTMYGRLAKIEEHRLWVRVPTDEVAKLAPLLDEAKKAPRTRAKPPWTVVDADRLIAWQLYWRGENFWSGDEIWGRTDEMRTAFKQTDNAEFLKYLKEPERAGKKFFIMTESGRVNSLRGILPTTNAKDSLEILNTDSNKFTLVSFTL